VFCGHDSVSVLVFVSLIVSISVCLSLGPLFVDDQSLRCRLGPVASGSSCSSRVSSALWMK